MNLIFRLLAIALATFRRPRLGLLDESVVRLTVLPTDLDVNGHMNNGRYLTIMDLGRVDLFLRTGIVAGMRRHRWSGVVASVAVRFRRALDPFARYELRSRLLCWDERWVFMEQRFTRRGELCAYGLVKIQFSGRGGRIAPQEMMDAVAPGTGAPPIPQAVRDWMDSEDRLVSGERPAAAVLA
ncbi:MAG: thioesterase family protein [Gemmatimonadetes bacterium]|nr:thioesterase family protein [Gemmatimonadota bacterium]